MFWLIYLETIILTFNYILCKDKVKLVLTYNIRPATAASVQFVDVGYLAC